MYIRIDASNNTLEENIDIEFVQEKFIISSFWIHYILIYLSLGVITTLGSSNWWRKYGIFTFNV